VHQSNFELVAAGIFNSWVQKSLDKLAILMPGRYAKNEMSSGFVGSIQTYAYRMPIAPPIGLEGQQLAQRPEAADEAAPEVEAVITSETAEVESL
jgi:hypothetical protein